MNQSSNSSVFDAHQLCIFLSSLAPGDLSVNEAAAARPGAAMMTSVGSPNDELWLRMEQVGWTRRVPGDLPAAPPTSTYTMTEAGARAVTMAVSELIARRALLMGTIKGFDPRSAPEHLTRLCAAFGWLALRTEALRTLAEQARPALHKSQARQRAYVQALNEIGGGLSMAASCIADAIAHGLDSDAGRDCLARTVAGLRYAEQCLTQWTAKMRAQPPGHWLSRFVAGIRSRF
ncbi:protein of unknown function [Bradyrhizobium sp. ORS 285]|nr:hypothetical protein BRAO285_200114 [Bradyrhizobium sp. ORS 285]SMX59818.1 protein of unknown function [Bradyrhizobium sp. ORS 285]